MNFSPSVLRKSVLCTLLVAGLPALTACSSVSSVAPTPYQAAKSDTQYGYSSTQLTANEYRIMFRATEATDAALVQEYALYHAAEVARENNFEYLTIVKTDVERKSSTGKRIVKEPEGTPQNPIVADPQCTMSGCTEIGQTIPAQGGELRVETTMMEDVYFSILVRMANSQNALGDKAFRVENLLTDKPG